MKKSGVNCVTTRRNKPRKIEELAQKPSQHPTESAKPTQFVKEQLNQPLQQN